MLPDPALSIWLNKLDIFCSGALFILAPDTALGIAAPLIPKIDMLI